MTATWCELVPGRPVTIGRPLPTYCVVMLEPRTRRRASSPTARSARSASAAPASPAGTWACRRRPPTVFVTHPATGDPPLPHRRPRPVDRRRRDRVPGPRGRRGEDPRPPRRPRRDRERAARRPRGRQRRGRADPGGGGDAGSGDLAAYVVGEIADAEALDDPAGRRLLRERLPAYMIPATLDVLDELPTQASGKVDRAQLPAPSGRRLVAATGPVVAAEGELEEQIARRVGRGVRPGARRALGRGRLLRRARRPLPARRHAP